MKHGKSNSKTVWFLLLLEVANKYEMRFLFIITPLLLAPIPVAYLEVNLCALGMLGL